MKKIKSLICYLMSGMLCLTSCVTQRKMTYFSDLDKFGTDSINTKYHPAAEPVIRNADKLVILVSAVDPEAVVPFNLRTINEMSTTSLDVSNAGKLQYYTVDTEGNISFPVIGKVHLAGMTKAQAVDMLQTKISAWVNNPTVTINFIGPSVTIMGEVNAPGRYEMTAERTSVLDALALAKDLTVYGKRDNILLTRENNGKLEFVRLNLNSPELFMSPYYYLQPNDVIYVEPNRVRAIASQNISLYLSMITTLASMATVIVSVVKK